MGVVEINAFTKESLKMFMEMKKLNFNLSKLIENEKEI